MTATISNFRNVVDNDGFVKNSNNEKTPITQYKSGIIHKVKTFIFGHDAKANKEIRADFISALKKEYGSSFVNSKGVSALLNADQDFKTNAKPLSARLVRHIISIGDIVKAEKSNYSSQIEAKLHINNKDYDVKLSYTNTQSMHAAADRFFDQANFDREGSVLMRDVAGYINRPTGEQFSALSGSPGAVKFVGLFDLFDGVAVLNMATPDFKNHCLSIGVNPNDITTPAIGKAQIPTRLNMLCSNLASSAHESPAFFEGAVKELVEYVPRQIEILKNGIDALSEPKIIFDGMSDKDIQTLAAFKVQLELQLAEMIDADGLCQQFLAFATVVAMDTAAAQAKMQVLPPKVPTKMELLAEGRRQAIVAVPQGGAEINVRSSYKNIESMRAAANSFVQQSGFNSQGSALLSDIVGAINLPSQQKLAALFAQPNGERAVRFAEAFGVVDRPYLSHMLQLAIRPDFVSVCRSLSVDPTLITNAAIANVQQPIQLLMTSETLARNASLEPAKFKGIVEEVVSLVPNQVRTLEQGIQALSNPKLTAGLVEQDVKAISDMRDGLTAMLNELTDPDGPSQQLLAYATVAAMDLGTAQSQMQAVLNPQPQMQAGQPHA